MARVIFPEYRDQYETTNYPFMDTATLTDASRTLVLPQNLFLDAGFCFPEPLPYLSQLEVQTARAIFTITAGRDTASCTVDMNALPDVLYFTTASGRQMGCLVSEKVRLSWLSSLDAGTYTFYPEATSFAVRCNLPSKVLGVSSICSDEAALTGDVWLVGGHGVFLRHMGGNHIRIDIMGEVLHRRDRCSAALPAQNCLRSINGVYSDAYGRLVIGLQAGTEHQTKLRINTTTDGLEVTRA